MIKQLLGVPYIINSELHKDEYHILLYLSFFFFSFK